MRLLALSQGIEQMSQCIMVQLIHQCQEAAKFAFRKTFSGHPAEIMPRQIRNQAPLIFPIRHFTSRQ